MKINGGRLRSRIEKINEASKDPSSGYTRLAFSEEDAAARAAVTEMMKEAGLNVRTDTAGNILGVLYPKDWNDKELKGVVAAGSHIDTVKNGGPYDGLYGSMAAIEAAQCIAENGLQIKRPLEIIIFADEEGARFHSGMIGSKSIAGLAMEKPLREYTDACGVNLYDEMTARGYSPDRLQESAAPEGKYKYFVELHIEQGIVLEQKNKQIGIVTGIKGPYWIEGVFEGESNHAGGTPMNMRKDALTAAANFAAEVERIASGIGDMFVATIGSFRVFPGGINTIPRRVEYTIDIRDTDMERRARGIDLINQAAERCAEKFGTVNRQRCVKNAKSENMSPEIMDIIERTCIDGGYSYMKLPSGPFHDTLSMARLCETGMIFVPSIGGISHSPYEDTRPDDLDAGAQVLLDTLSILLK